MGRPYFGDELLLIGMSYMLLVINYGKKESGLYSDGMKMENKSLL